MKSINKSNKGSSQYSDSTTAGQRAEQEGFNPETGSKLLKPEGVFSDEDLKELGISREEHDARRGATPPSVDKGVASAVKRLMGMEEEQEPTQVTTRANPQREANTPQMAERMNQIIARRREMKKSADWVEKLLARKNRSAIDMSLAKESYPDSNMDDKSWEEVKRQMLFEEGVKETFGSEHSPGAHIQPEERRASQTDQGASDWYQRHYPTPKTADTRIPVRISGVPGDITDSPETSTFQTNDPRRNPKVPQVNVYENQILNSLAKLMKADVEDEHKATERIRGIEGPDAKPISERNEDSGGYELTDAERAAGQRYRRGEFTGPEGTPSRTEALWGSTAPKPARDVTQYQEDETGRATTNRSSGPISSPTAEERADTIREHGAPTESRAAQMMAPREKDPQKVQVHNPSGAIVASLLKLMKAPSKDASPAQVRSAEKARPGNPPSRGTETGMQSAEQNRQAMTATAGQGGDDGRAEGVGFAGQLGSLLGAKAGQEFYDHLRIPNRDNPAVRAGAGAGGTSTADANQAAGISSTDTAGGMSSIGDGSDTGGVKPGTEGKLPERLVSLSSYKSADKKA